MIFNLTEKLVITSLFSILTLSSAIFIYYKIWPKRKIPSIVLIILLSIPPLISILRPGTYESGDLSLHSAGTLSFFNAIVDGDLIPRWGGEIINGYGTPHHQIMYFLPRYIPSLIHFLGIPILISMKIYLILTYIASGIGMYLFVKKELGDLPGIVGSVFYLYAPYHLIDLHFRVSIGELLAFSILPFCFLSLLNLLEKQTIKNVIVFSITITLIILSHMAIASFTIPILAIYSFVKVGSFRISRYFGVLSGLLMGIFLSSFYLFPLLLESKFMLYSRFKGVALYPLNELLYSPYRFGFLFQGNEGDLSFVIGYIQLLILPAVAFLIFKLKKRPNIELLFYFLIVLFLIFLITPVSRPLWDSIPILRGFESSYRLMLLVSFFTSILAAFITNRISQSKILNKKKFGSSRSSSLIIILIIALAIFQTILNWGNRRNIPSITDDSYFETIIPTYLIGLKSSDYATPIWVNVEENYFRELRVDNLEIIKGNANIRELIRKNSHHQYIVEAQSQVTLKENTFFFPGWTLYINNQKKPFKYKNPSFPGIIYFNLEPGLNKIDLKFENSNVRKYSNLISLISLIIIVLLYISTYYRPFFHKRR